MENRIKKTVRNVLIKVLPSYRLSDVDRRDADSAAMVCMFKTMAAIQVKVTYGLTFKGVSASIREQAAQLSGVAAGDDIARKDKAQLLHMSGVLDSLADELEFEGAKGNGK